MPATIKIKNSSTASAVPTSSDLVQGELAVNVTDKRIFTENASGTVVELGTNPSILTLPDGSASAPTLTNDGDTNTGIFFPAADTIAFATNGTEDARFDSAGNFGVGLTPSGNYQLQAGSGSGAAGRGFNLMTLAGGYSGGDYPIFGYNFRTTTTGGSYLYNGSDVASAIGFSSVITFNTASSGTAGNSISFSERMRLDASGNLGIGTTSPSSKLEVAGQLKVRFANPDTVGIILQASTGTNAAAMNFANTGGNGYVGLDSSTGTRISGAAYSLNVWHEGAYPVVFGTNNTERARIDSSGNLLVGTTSQLAAGRICLAFSGSTNQGWVSNDTGGGSGSQHLRFLSAGTNVGNINTTTTATAYTTSSDYRLKENIAPMTGALATVAQLNPVTYTWKATGEATQGFIAHELQAVVPEAVVGEKDAVDAEGNPVYQGIDTSFLVATLTAAIQELKAIVDAQAVEIAALKGQA
jgi:hypothetical protein